MEEKRKAVVGLTKLGLPVGEARAYVALLENGPSEATPLAKLAEVPQPKIYSYLSDLEKSGLVTKLEMEGKPNIYNPISYDIAIAHLKSELLENLSATENVLQAIQEKEKPKDKIAYVSLSQGKKAVEASLISNFEKIKTRAIIFSGSFHDELITDYMTKQPHVDIFRPIQRLTDNFDILPPFIQNFLNLDLLQSVTQLQPMFLMRDYDPINVTCDAMVIVSQDQSDEDSSILIEITHPDITKLQLSIAMAIIKILDSFLPNQD